MTDEPTSELVGRPWPGPLGSPYLSDAQRQRLAEDMALGNAAQLRADDDSLPARQMRATAAAVREHREAGPERGAQVLHDNIAARRIALAKLHAAAQRDWQRLAHMPREARTTLVAERAWQRGYTNTYPTAYTTAAARIVTAATDAGLAHPAAWPTLYPLAVAAGDVISQLDPREPFAPPVDQRALTAAKRAANATGQPWRPIAKIASASGQTAGTLAGTLTAATDILVGWRARGGKALSGDLAINGRPDVAGVIHLLATINRDIAELLSTRSTAARLARQGQQSGIATTHPGPSRRPRPSTGRPHGRAR